MAKLLKLVSVEAIEIQSIYNRLVNTGIGGGCHGNALLGLPGGLAYLS